MSLFALWLVLTLVLGSISSVIACLIAAPVRRLRHEGGRPEVSLGTLRKRGLILVWTTAPIGVLIGVLIIRSE